MRRRAAAAADVLSAFKLVEHRLHQVLPSTENTENRMFMVVMQISLQRVTNGSRRVIDIVRYFCECNVR
jgi:hypothetical protein